MALDMPGRGGSTVPANLWFGVVTPEDCATAILGALDQLRALHIQPDTVFAHRRVVCWCRSHSSDCWIEVQTYGRPMA